MNEGAREWWRLSVRECGRILDRTALFYWVLVILLLFLTLDTVFDTYSQYTSYRDRYPDSASVYRIVEFARTGQLYPDLQEPPYLATLYGPLFYTTLSISCQLRGCDNRVGPQLRRIILVVFLVCLSFVFLISSRLCGAVGGVLGVLLTTSAGILSGWVVAIRPEFFGIAFALLSLLTIAAQGRHSPLWGGILAGVAFLFKQTFLAAPAACLLWFLWRRAYRKAIGYAVCWGVVALGVYGWFGWSEPWFWFHLTALSPPLVDLHHYWGHVENVLGSLPTYFALGGVFLLLDRKEPFAQLLVSYIGMSWAIALLTLVQIGANVNYFFEPLFASAPAGAYALAHLRRVEERSPRWVGAIICCFLVIGLGMPLSKSLLRKSLAFQDATLRLASKQRQQQFEQLRRTIEKRRVLTLAPDLAIVSPRPDLLDPFLNHVLEKTGKWDPNPLKKDIKNQVFDFIILHTQAWKFRGLDLLSPTLADEIQRAYRPYCRAIGLTFYLRQNEDTDALGLELQKAGCR